MFSCKQLYIILTFAYDNIYRNDSGIFLFIYNHVLNFVMFLENNTNESIIDRLKLIPNEFT